MYYEICTSSSLVGGDPPRFGRSLQMTSPEGTHAHGDVCSAILSIHRAGLPPGMSPETSKSAQWTYNTFGSRILPPWLPGQGMKRTVKRGESSNRVVIGCTTLRISPIKHIYELPHSLTSPIQYAESFRYVIWNTMWCLKLDREKKIKSKKNSELNPQ